MYIRYFFMLLAMCVGVSLMGQDTLLYETFQSGTLNGFTSIDVDGLPLSEDFEGLDGGFQVLAVAGASDFRAIGVSSFANGGTANNYLISPPVEINKAFTMLQWEANSLSGDPGQAESYEVLLSRTGTEVADFTDVLEIVAAETNTTREVDLSFYEGSTVHLAFRQNGSDKFALTIDDILVTQPSSDVDVEIVDILGDKYMDVTNLTLDPSVLIMNTGSDTLTEVLLEVTINGVVSQLAFGGLSIDPQSSDVLPLGIEQADKYEIEVRVISANTIAQSAPAIMRTFYLYEGGPSFTQVMEVATSTTCGWCPGDIVSQQQAAASSADLITLSVHIDDPMVTPVYAFGFQNLDDFGGVPSAFVNRNESGQTADYQTLIANGGTSPVSIQVNNIYDPITRALSIDMSGTAFTRFDAEDIRLSVLIVEDSITGTTQLFDQANNYSVDNQNVPLVGPDGRNWQTETDPVPASEMVYNEVVRDLVGGFDGIINSASTTGVGGIFDHQVDYILPSVYDENQVSLVVMVLDAEDGRILQATEQKLDIISSVADFLKINFNVYPNPIFDTFTIDSGEGRELQAYQLVNPNGQIVVARKGLQLSENQLIKVDCIGLPSGIYTLRVTDGQAWESHKVVLLTRGH